MAIRVLLVEDHNVMREALRSLLEKNPNLQVIGEASNGREAVNLARRISPDLVMMDVTMPNLNGMEATRMIKQECAGAKVLALSMHTDRQYVIGMFRAGASAYLLKNCSYEELQEAIKTVLKGGSYISPEIAEVVVSELHRGVDDESGHEIEKLTVREREILQMIAEAKKSKEIAEQLCISLKTVYTHRRNIMEKLKARNLSDLTRFAIKTGITSLDQ